MQRLLYEAGADTDAGALRSSQTGDSGCHRLYQAHYAEKIDLETIASQIHLSKYYFCRIFREVTGATVLEYLTNVRLTRAGRLLVESSLAIQEIAQKTGFASLVHFSRTYRNAYGVSPSDTRRRRKA